jgi:hypothetical protein
MILHKNMIWKAEREVGIGTDVHHSVRGEGGWGTGSNWASKTRVTMSIT